MRVDDVASRLVLVLAGGDVAHVAGDGVLLALDFCHLSYNYYYILTPLDPGHEPGEAQKRQEPDTD